MESSGPIFLTKGNDIPYLYVLTFGWKPYFSTILSVTHLSFIVINGKRTFTSHEVMDLNHLNQNTEILIIIHFFKFAVCFPIAEGVGFEPTDPFRGQCFSRAPQSTTLPPLHNFILNMSKTNLLKSLQIYKEYFKKPNNFYSFLIFFTLFIYSNKNIFSRGSDWEQGISLPPTGPWFQRDVWWDIPHFFCWDYWIWTNDRCRMKA